MTTTSIGVMAPLTRSMRKTWMPRPFPGGRSTCVGKVSRRGELNVPTYPTSGPAAWLAFLRARRAVNGEIPARATVVFRNERRERSLGSIPKGRRRSSLLRQVRDCDVRSARRAGASDLEPLPLPPGPLHELPKSWVGPDAVQVPIVLGEKWVIDHPARNRGVEPEQRLVLRPNGGVGTGQDPRDLLVPSGSLPIGAVGQAQDLARSARHAARHIPIHHVPTSESGCAATPSVNFSASSSCRL